MSNPEYVRNLEDVKVGDKFFVRSTRWGYGVEYDAVECTAITPKQCTIGTSKWRKDDARCLGDPYQRLYAYTEELIEEMCKIKRKRRVYNFDYRTLSDDQCERIYTIIMEAKP